MSLPTLADAKSYLKRETDAEDALITQLLARAKGLVQMHLGVPITATERTMYDDGGSGYWSRGVTTLQAPLYPFSGAVIRDADGDVVDATGYRVNGQLGQIYGDVGVSFWNGPYAIVATVGMSEMEDYEEIVEPVIAAAILDVVADLYQNRDPGATSKSSGGGVSVSRSNDGIPERICQYLNTIRPARLGG